MSFCDSLITNILYVFNFFVAITGLTLVAIGTFAQVYAQNYINFMGKQFSYSPISIIVVGVVIFVIAFFGCCGARQKNHCMLRTYAALLILIFIVEIVAGIAAYVLKGALKDELAKNMKEGMNNFNETGFEGMTQTWDLLQHELECCGVYGKEDWLNSTVGINSTMGVNSIVDVISTVGVNSIVEVISTVGDNSTVGGNSTEGKTPDSNSTMEKIPDSNSNVGNIPDSNSNVGKIPDSCCPGGVMGLGCEDSSKFEKGCLSNIEHHLRSNIDVVGGVAIGVCVLQLFGFILSCIIRTNGDFSGGENLSMQEI